jgi:hypothetical protein
MPTPAKMPTNTQGDSFVIRDNENHRLLIKVNEVRDGIKTQYTDLAKSPNGDPATYVDLVDFDAKGEDGNPRILRNVQVMTRVPEDKLRRIHNSSGPGTLAVVKVVKRTGKSGSTYFDLEDLEPAMAEAYWDRFGDPFKAPLPPVAAVATSAPAPAAAQAAAPAAAPADDATPDWMKD